jgi:hypothetical protein
MLQHPLLPSPADGRRDTVIVLDPTTCTGKYRKATRLALEGAEELALIASDAALQGSEKLFEEFFGTTDKSIRAKVAARFQSIAANAHVTSAGKKSPRIPIKYYCQGGPDYEFLTGRPDPCAAAPGAHAITRNSNHIVNVSFPHFRSLSILLTFIISALCITNIMTGSFGNVQSQASLDQMGVRSHCTN